MKVGSLFSGIGGLDLGLERAGMTVIWQSEIDPFCTRILAKHWPTVTNLGDITRIDWRQVEPVDLICGGYPCQPFSYAGNRKGEADERHLWPHMLDAISILRPQYALLENVAGHLTLGFDRVLADLAGIGFDAEWSTVSACAMGAPHSRSRVFCLAYPQDAYGENEMHVTTRGSAQRPQPGGSSSRSRRSDWWIREPPLDRMADGVPARMVRAPLHALGNAVVPQVAEYVGRNILEGDHK